MSFSLGGEQLGSSQEPSSFWEFMATNSGRNEEGGPVCGGKDRASPDLLLIARGHSVDTRKLYYTQRVFAPTIWGKKKKIQRDPPGEQWILDQFPGVGQRPHGHSL